MQHGIRRAAGGGDRRDGVLERGAVHHVERSAVLAQELHYLRARGAARDALARIVGGDARVANRREAQQLGRERHRVRRVLSAAGARSRASDVLELLQRAKRHLPRGVRAHRLEHVLDGHVAVLESAGRDGPAVEEQRRKVEAQERHRAARDRLVASDQHDGGVEHVRAAHQLDGVGDDLPADERPFHALGAHHHAVADGDGVELHGRRAGRPDALLHPLRQAAQVEVARHRLRPGVRDGDQRARQLLGGEPDRLEHRARGGAVGTLGQRAALVSLVVGHGLLRSPAAPPALRRPPRRWSLRACRPPPHRRAAPRGRSRSGPPARPPAPPLPGQMNGAA